MIRNCSLVEVFVVVDELSALESAEVESVLSLVERLILIELVAVGSPHDVSVKVLFGNE